ncbi:hypothetical protein D3C87_1991590 [compost metagenome]
MPIAIPFAVPVTASNPGSALFSVPLKVIVTLFPRLISQSVRFTTNGIPRVRVF